MDPIILKHCAEIEIAIADGEVFITQKHERTDPHMVNIPLDRILHFLSSIRELCEAHGIPTDGKSIAKINSHVTSLPN